MGKAPYDTRQITIERLREFLRESVNLEPELERFVRTLIFSLEYSTAGHPGGYDLSDKSQSKVQH